ncbi:MAG: ABC transporter permease [Chlamydiia bacterium]|nr:ABC transporter permease [Chlamydiia bacterium]
MNRGQQNPKNLTNPKLRTRFNVKRFYTHRFSRISSLIIKEFIAVWRDKKSRFILIFPPIWQLFVFAFAATLDVQNITIGILNRDSGEKGFELVQRFCGSPYFTHIVYLPSVESITPFIDNQKGTLVLSIDETFSRKIDANEPATVQLILDGRKTNTAQIIAGYVQSILAQYNLNLTASFSESSTKIELIPRNWFNPNLLYPWFTVPGLLGILTMVVTLLIIVMAVARERELGTFDQLLVSPLTPSEIVIGKAIPAIFLGMIEGTIIVLAILFVFQIPFYGSLPLLYFAMFFYVAAITGVGLFISSLCRTQQQAILGAFVFLTPSILLSGFATPIENMPNWLQTATLINPTRYFIYISRGTFLKAIPPITILDNTWPLALIALCVLVSAGYFFRNRFT